MVMRALYLTVHSIRGRSHLAELLKKLVWFVKVQYKCSLLEYNTGNRVTFITIFVHFMINLNHHSHINVFHRVLCTIFIACYLSFPALSTPLGNCVEEELRLADSTDDKFTQSKQGRLEVCINNAWGTVCNSDNTFGPRDALVACQQLVGFQSAGAQVVHITAPPATGPIFLDRLLCTGTESSLLDCLSDFGVVECSHDQDVFIRCIG